MKWTKAIVTIISVLVLCSAGPAAAGPSKNGKAVAFARVHLADGTIKSFGGNKTTSATLASFLALGDVTVRFTGKYPKDITLNQVIVQATCEYGLYCVANAQVVSASPTEILIEVGAWTSNTTNPPPGGNDAFLTVFIGQ